MNKFLLLLVLAFSTTFLRAQCDIDNNSFEDWTLQEITGSGVDFSEVLLPDSVAPAIRTLFWAFTGDQALIDSLIAVDPIGFLGMEQSTDASDGNFALKLQSKYADVNEVADVYHFNSCSEVPDSFAVDIKHVGIGEDDIISMAVVFDQGLPSLFDEPGDNPYSGAVESLELTDESEYARYVIPIEENFESEVDTFFYIIAAETTDSTYYLIDNVEFIYKEPSSVSNAEVLNSIALTHNPVYENLSIAIQEPINIPVDLFITDMHGKTYVRKSYQSLQSNLEFDISDMPSGSYNLQVRSREGISTLKFIKI